VPVLTPENLSELKFARAGAYLRHNYEFHKTLYSFAGAPILESLADNLWLRYGPSLRVVCGRVGTQNLVDHHKQAIAAVRNGQFDDAAAAMSADVNEGIDYYSTKMDQDDEPDFQPRTHP